MTYSKTTWVTGEEIDAIQLNNIEQGVSDAHDLIAATQSTQGALSGQVSSLNTQAATFATTAYVDGQVATAATPAYVQAQVAPLATTTYVDSKVANVTVTPSAPATTSAAGLVQLAGDLGGTATVPTVTSGTHHSHTSGQISDASSTGLSVLTGSAAAARTALQAPQGGIQVWSGVSWSARPTGVPAGFVTSYSDGTHGSTRDANATPPPDGLDGDAWELVLS